MELVESIEVKGERASSGKGVLWEGVAFDSIGNIYNKKEYIPFIVSTHVECCVLLIRK
ncbi:hypothetical protein QOZ95_005229 [Paenibacillus brasilensis]|uniref:Uncharacterized protein n=1 Tax=Paenibacillus brasilensis TaxID=128574 RepID=A0ABU0L6X6_9BACL|nr:hypothetical protein [Paenibacillus brasilensis]